MTYILGIEGSRNCQVSEVDMDCICFNISISVYIFFIFALNRIHAQIFYYSTFPCLCQRNIWFLSLLAAVIKVHFGVVTKSVEVNSVCFFII